METKFCKKCERELPLTMFYKDKTTKSGYAFYCKDCKLKQAKEYQQTHKEEKKAYKKKYWEENKHRFVEERRKYREEHREDMRKWHKQDYAKNREKILAEGYRRKKERLKTDSLYRYKEKIGHFVRCGFYRKGFQKPDTTENIVGCTAEELRAYLNETFYKNYGYEYDGTDKVHIDHIIPLATANTEEEVAKLYHYTNLQLLKAEHNQMKSDRLDFELPPLP
jgi:hypothetical protein